jgi:cobalt-precorrin 5A hydrolase
MFERGIAVVAVTRRGVETALKIQKALDYTQLHATVYAPQKYSQLSGVVALEKKLPEFFAEVYKQVDGLVAVMATGITIRAVAPLLESKLTDPAVVGVDAQGKFVISLLSGHLGGANDLTHIIAQGINAIPVITTASDIMGKQSVEDLAKKLQLKIENFDSLVALNSAIVNGDRIVVVLVGAVKLPTTAFGSCEVRVAQDGTDALDIISSFDAGIIITSDPLTITKFTKPFIILKMRKIVVGLGARKESTPESMIQAVDMALEKIHVPLLRIYAFATVDIKRSSPQMIDAVAKMGAPIEFLSVEELSTVTYSDLSPDSAMVQSKIGIGGVCERAALKIAGPNAKLILKKTKLNGVTVAVAMGE